PAPRAEKSDRADRFEAAARADTLDTPEAARGEEPAPAPRESAAAAAPAPAKDARYTVQVAAYKARAPADSLRASLAAAGHDAYVVEGDGPGGVPYRVRVGSFATREAAQEAAARLGRERSLTAFVTAR
ncbi:MAG: SPOR domain-containing protein, partial [Candidatus Rokubacteria bacterium]|nr:SPOR domain-containing protein [Candidatus Rokubacteria bacterium]